MKFVFSFRMEGDLGMFVGGKIETRRLGKDGNKSQREYDLLEGQAPGGGRRE